MREQRIAADPTDDVEQVGRELFAVVPALEAQIEAEAAVDIDRANQPGRRDAARVIVLVAAVAAPGVELLGIERQPDRVRAIPRGVVPARRGRWREHRAQRRLQRALVAVRLPPANRDQRVIIDELQQLAILEQERVGADRAELAGPRDVVARASAVPLGPVAEVVTAARPAQLHSPGGRVFDRGGRGRARGLGAVARRRGEPVLRAPELGHGRQRDRSTFGEAVDRVVVAQARGRSAVSGRRTGGRDGRRRLGPQACQGGRAIDAVKDRRDVEATAVSSHPQRDGRSPRGVEHSRTRRHEARLARDHATDQVPHRTLADPLQVDVDHRERVLGELDPAIDARSRRSARPSRRRLATPEPRDPDEPREPGEPEDGHEDSNQHRPPGTRTHDGIVRRATPRAVTPATRTGARTAEAPGTPPRRRRAIRGRWSDIARGW